MNNVGINGVQSEIHSGRSHQKIHKSSELLNKKESIPTYYQTQGSQVGADEKAACNSSMEYNRSSITGAYDHGPMPPVILDEQENLD